MKTIVKKKRIFAAPLALPSLFTVLLLASLVGPPKVQALTLQEAVQQRLENAPQVGAAKNILNVAKDERIARFIPEEPEFLFTNTDSNTEQSYGFSENVGFPGKAFALAKKDKAEVTKQKDEYEATRYDLVKDTVQAYLQCAAATSTTQIQKTNLESVQTMSDYIRSRYEAGVATLAEVISARLQAKQQSYELVGSQNSAEVSCEKLGKLLHETETPNNYELPDDLDPSILEMSGEQTSDEERAEGMMEVAKATQKTASWNTLPDLSFNYERNRYGFLPGSPNGERWTTTYGVGMNIPIFYGANERLQAKKEKNQAILDKANSEVALLNARSDRATASREYRRAIQRLSELRQKDLPLAEAALESAYTGYRTGKIGFAEMLIVRKTLADLRIEDIQLRTAIINNHLICLNDCGSDKPLNETLISYVQPKKNKRVD